MARLPDQLKIEAVGAGGGKGVLDNFTSFMITHDLTSPSEAALELGDDGSWASLEQYIAPGTEYRVFLNDRLSLSGRVEVDDIPLDAEGGAVVRFTVRTKIADAMYASARQKIRVKNTSIKDFLLELYDPLGYAESDFVFDPATSRDLMTGKDTANKGRPTRVDLEPIKLDAARVNPPETIYAAADRHLRRHGLLHWDTPDGKIVVSAPNDSQDPIYYLRMMRGERGRENNILGATRTKDYSGIPSVVGVFGVGGKSNFAKSKVSALAKDDDVIAAGFHRPVSIIAEAIKTNALAERAAAREMSARSKRKDAWELEIDGLSWWSGTENVPWGIDTVCNVETDLAGGALGAYYIHRVVQRRDADSGDVTNLSVLRRGIWRL